ncbi:hypothetical protein LSAT2_012363 [Lamellibrachia satsuma]|nr:hypothetical protein LSAT2_012363 [Lamellibrachia satsuma]
MPSINRRLTAPVGISTEINIPSGIGYLVHNNSDHVGGLLSTSYQLNSWWSLIGQAQQYGSDNSSPVFDKDTTRATTMEMYALPPETPVGYKYIYQSTMKQPTTPPQSYTPSCPR